MSDCVTKPDLERFLAGELSAGNHARVAAHLTACPACAAADRALRDSREALLAQVRIAVDNPTPMTRTGQTPVSGFGGERPPVRPPAGAPGDAIDLHAAGHSRNAPAFVLEGYRFLSEIHRGGQGVVYLAVQEATQRKVAIKVLREGPLADAQEVSRFKREVRILAQLNHPNIVTIHDSGVAESHSYYVMDYIDGEPLDEFVFGRTARAGVRGAEVAAPWTSRDTLAIFAQICEAVSVAHERGIIHRDLKPGNIRVDRSGAAHILDFGIAKVSTDHTGDHSIRTITGQFVGSLPWASPEQAEGAAKRVDATTDVYSLGVILFQLLTGRFPYPVVGSMREVLDHILRTEPARPSSIQRGIEAEVETIVLKCLSKPRERRYTNAGALAADVRRYLAGEPIEARRDSRLYVLRKRLPRYKVAGLVAAIAVIGAGSAWAISHQRKQLAAQQQRERETLVDQCRDALLLVDGERVMPLLDRAQALGVAEATLEPLRGWADLIVVDFPAARKRAVRAVELAPESAEARYLSAALLAYDGNWVGAANDFALAQKYSRGTPLEIGLQAIVKVTLRQYDSALADLDALVRRQNNSASTLWARGFCRWAQLMRDPPVDIAARRALAETALRDVDAAAQIYPRVAFLFDTRADLNFRFAEIVRVQGDVARRAACLEAFRQDVAHLQELGAASTAAVYFGTLALQEGDLDRAGEFAVAAVKGLAEQKPRALTNREDAQHAAVQLLLCVTIARGDAAMAQVRNDNPGLAEKACPTLVGGFFEGLHGGPPQTLAPAERRSDEDKSKYGFLFGEWMGAVARGDRAAAERIGRRFTVPMLQRFGPGWGATQKRVMEFREEGKALRRAAGAELTLVCEAQLAEALLAPTREARLAGLQDVVQMAYPGGEWLLAHALLHRAHNEPAFLSVEPTSRRSGT